MSYKTSFLIATSFAALLGAVAPQDAFADNDRGRGRGHGHERHDHRPDPRPNWGRNDYWKKNDRRIVYVQPRYTSRIIHYNYVPAPRYEVVYTEPVVIGQRLIRYEPVPQPVLYQLQPAPSGYFYSYHGDRVYMVRQQDNIVMQIIAMLTGQ